MEGVNGLEGLPSWLVSVLGIVLVLVLLLQATWLFIDATKRGNSWRWFWGIWGLIQFPMPTLLYWLLVRKPWQRGDRTNEVNNGKK